MKTHLFVYTGTGNSLWTARRIAGELGDAALHPIAGTDAAVPAAPGDAVGLIFPVHIWGVPRRVLSFLDRLSRDPSVYYFAVAVNAGQVAATLLQLRKVMEEHGLALSSGYSLMMPSNYIPWGGPGPEEKQRKRIRAAEEKIKRIARNTAERKILPVEKGPWWQNILFSRLYRMSFDQVPRMDAKFFADEKCNSCGICARVCPARNIELVDGRPVWQHRCEQCMACIQWCPREAIQYGGKTSRYPRYHHPEITLKDIIACTPEPKE